MERKQKDPPPHLVVSRELDAIINAEVQKTHRRKFAIVDDLLRLALRMRRLLPPEEVKQ